MSEKRMLSPQFLDYLRLEKHFSDYTVKSYGTDLVQFVQPYLYGQNYAKSTTARKLATLLPVYPV
jgi:site-specific recombinase XerD